MQGGRVYETGLLAGVMVLHVVLVGIFAHCPLKVNCVASHVVSLSEFHRIFANILVVIGAFWSASTFRVFNIFFAWSIVWIIAVVSS